MHVVAGKAVALLLAAGEEFRRDQRRTVENAAVLAEALAERGARIVSGGTDNHLMLVDVTPLGVTGKEAEALLDEVGITVNKNAIPFDPLPPNTASGIRLGTPATTTRGFGPDEMRAIARIITEAIARRDDPAASARLRDEVGRHRRPVPGSRACSPRTPGDLHRDRRRGAAPHRRRLPRARRSRAARDAARPARRPEPRILDHPDRASDHTTRRSRAAVASRSSFAFLVVGGGLVAASAARSRACPACGRIRSGEPLAPVRGRAPGRRDRCRRRSLRPSGPLAAPRPARPGRRRRRRRDHRRARSTIRSVPTTSRSSAPIGIAFTVVWVVGHDQQPQLHRRPRRPVDAGSRSSRR